MQKIKKTIALLFVGIVLASVFSGCSSSRTENGVSIESERNMKFW